MTTEATDSSQPTPPLGVSSSEGLGLAPERARVGDTVECDVRLPYPQTHRLTLETRAAADYANKLLADKSSGWRLVACAALLTGCVDMVQPADIAVAEELCAKRGGYAHAQRWERGAVLDVNCKDGTQIQVRLPKKA